MDDEHRAAQALVLAREAGDARVIGLVCEQLGMGWSACDDPDQLCNQVSEATTVAICTEEALHDAVAPLTQCLQRQPPWSDPPLIVLTFAPRASGWTCAGRRSSRWAT
jgi:hypothetical protein